MKTFEIIKTPRQALIDARKENGYNKNLDSLYKMWHIKCPICGFIKYLATNTGWKSNGCPKCNTTSRLPKKIIEYDSQKHL